LERYLAQTPAPFKGEEAMWTLYHALKRYAGLTSLLECDHPKVELGLLPRFHEGYLVAVNHGLESIRAPVTTALSLAEVRELGPDCPKPLAHDEHGSEIALDGYDGKTLHWRAVTSN
jgi:hypothetical protein